MITLPYGAAQTLQKPSAGEGIVRKKTISVIATDLKKELPIHLKNQSVFYRSSKRLFTLGLRPDVKCFSKTKLQIMSNKSLDNPKT